MSLLREQASYCNSFAPGRSIMPHYVGMPHREHLIAEIHSFRPWQICRGEVKVSCRSPSCTMMKVRCLLLLQPFRKRGTGRVGKTKRAVSVSCAHMQSTWPPQSLEIVTQFVRMPSHHVLSNSRSSKSNSGNFNSELNVSTKNSAHMYRSWTFWNCAPSTFPWEVWPKYWACQNAFLLQLLLIAASLFCWHDLTIDLSV